ncbi:MAG: aryl-sulfate sulfotransferase, partial [bacterium]|nr:aryl-sulfate sulfotransferase [Candidatus Kapabacteria bacterium]
MKTFALAVACALIATTQLCAQRTAASVEYHYPRSEATFVSRNATIIYRPGPRLDERSVRTTSVVTVLGSKSGRHEGRIALADDRRTVLFHPHAAFAPGESVDVLFAGGMRTENGDPVANYAYRFTTDRTPASAIAGIRFPTDLESESDEYATAMKSATPPAEDQSSSIGERESALPKMTVTVLDDPAPGRLYISNLTFDSTINTTPHALILDNDAVPVFQLPKGQPIYDFKRQPNGQLTYFDDEIKQFVILDSSYNQIGTINAGHGYETDCHELLILDNGHCILLGLAPRQVDLSGQIPGGNPNAIVLDMAIQELDAARNVVFEWRSVDHFKLTDATHARLTGKTVDHVHPNAISLDHEGNLLLSSRHLDEITKINRQTGEIIWRMGGKNNQFTFINDPVGFSYQHDARWFGEETMTLYDNGNYNVPRVSRAIEYRVDEVAMTATLVWQYRHKPDIFSYAMGNAQRLPNGNTLSGWGSYPNVTEVRRDGSVAFELAFAPGVYTYRAFRLPAATSLVRTDLVSPPRDSSEIVTNILLEWNRTGGAATYHVQVATDSLFTSVETDHVGIIGTTDNVEVLRNWTQYYWRVRAHGDEITGMWSDVWTFNTGGTGVVQRLVRPNKGTEGIVSAPVLQWSEFPNALSYHVQMSANDLSFRTTVL